MMFRKTRRKIEELERRIKELEKKVAKHEKIILQEHGGTGDGGHDPEEKKETE